MEVEKITDKMGFLEELILHIDSDVKFQMTMQWALIGVMVAAVGTSLVIIAKNMFDGIVTRELKKYKDEIINDVTDFKTTTVMRDAALQGIQTVSISKSKINAIIVKGYIIGGNSCKLIKDTLNYTENGASHDSIKLKCPNGATSEVRVKQLVENGLELEWVTNGEVPDITVGLDIMIL